MKHLDRLTILYLVESFCRKLGRILILLPGEVWLQMLITTRLMICLSLEHTRLGLVVIAEAKITVI